MVDTGFRITGSACRSLRGGFALRCLSGSRGRVQRQTGYGIAGGVFDGSLFRFCFLLSFRGLGFHVREKFIQLLGDLSLDPVAGEHIDDHTAFKDQ